MEFWRQLLADLRRFTADVGGPRHSGTLQSMLVRTLGSGYSQLESYVPKTVFDGLSEECKVLLVFIFSKRFLGFATALEESGSLAETVLGAQIAVCLAQSLTQILALRDAGKLCDTSSLI